MCIDEWGDMRVCLGDPERSATPVPNRTGTERKGKERKSKARDASAVVDAGSATSKESVEDEGKEEREPRRSYADEGASGSEGARELERGASADSARV